MAKLLMVQGCSSNAGKSTIVAGLCHYLRKKGVRVYPFKPQNMSLHSVALSGGCEMARAQFVQAMACGVEPSVHMSPVLLKPESDSFSQLVIQGKVADRVTAWTWREQRKNWMPFVLDSFYKICAFADVVLIEGAGSPAEINLREGDIANMGFATAVECPVILVGDIELGGVFAQLYGTLALLSEKERGLVQGVLINRFRGDMRLLETGLSWLEKNIHKPVFGVLPYLDNFLLDAEDGLSLDRSIKDKKEAMLKIGVINYPRMSNANDFEPLVHHKNIDLVWLSSPDQYVGCDALILPGSKSTIADLRWLKSMGFVSVIKRHIRYGGRVFGVCGGFQMLGQVLDNSAGTEGERGVFEGLGLLDMHTTFGANKRLAKRTGKLVKAENFMSGYEMHVGDSVGDSLVQNPLFSLRKIGASGFEVEGYASLDGLVLGSYLHGLFDDSHSFLTMCKLFGVDDLSQPCSFESLRMESLECLSNRMSEHLSLSDIERILGV